MGRSSSVHIEGVMMRKGLVRSLLVAAGAASMVGILAGPASADPTASKNAFPGTANCGTAGSFQFVVNNANGQGSGAQNNGQNQAEWAPAHLSPGNGVFHPTAFNNLTFTFTPAPGSGGTPQSFTNNDVRPNQAGNVTCQISGSQTDPAGDTFSVSGGVTGFIS
jgi:hypothetical protein